MFDPVPVVAINGVEVASGLTGGPGPVVVDDLSISWGRDSLFEQPDAPAGRLVLFDPTAVWATSVDRRGQLVTLAWAARTPGAARTVFFRGRLGTPSITRKTVRINGQPVKGALVELPLTSVLLDLSNRTPTGAWPEETVAARVSRIAGLLPGGIAVRDYWQAPHMAPVKADDQRDLLTHLRDVYDSTGVDRMTYRPDTEAITYVPRRDYSSARGHGRLVADPVGADTPRAGLGAYVRGVGNSATMPYLDGGVTGHPGSIEPPPKITRVEHKHPSGSTADYPLVTYLKLVPGTDENVIGVRAVRLESQLSWDNYATTAAEDLVEMARWEGRVWTLQDLRVRTKLTGGFTDLEHAQLLLAGWEDYTKIVFVERSEFTPLGVMPVFGIMGGTIGYRDGGWDILIKTAPIRTGPTRHAITFEEIDDGTPANEVQWWDDDHPHGMHESLTFEDLGFTTRGVGVSVIGPDTGFDEENFPA